MAHEPLDSPEMRELVGKLAAWPHGLGFLHVSDLDTVAVTLHADPYVVARAREALETPDGRARLIEAVREHRRKHKGRPAETPCPPAHPEAHLAPRALTAEQLVRAAAKHPLGVEFLRDGHPEAVAVIFQVHPRVVFRARELLEEQDQPDRSTEDT